MGSEVLAAYLTHMHLVCLLDFCKIVCVSDYPLVIAYVILDLDCMKSENILNIPEPSLGECLPCGGGDSICNGPPGHLSDLDQKRNLLDHNDTSAYNR